MHRLRSSEKCDILVIVPALRRFLFALAAQEYSERRKQRSSCYQKEGFYRCKGITRYRLK